TAPSVAYYLPGLVLAVFPTRRSSDLTDDRCGLVDVDATHGGRGGRVASLVDTRAGVGLGLAGALSREGATHHRVVGRIDAGQGIGAAEADHHVGVVPAVGIGQWQATATDDRSGLVDVDWSKGSGVGDVARVV